MTSTQLPDPQPSNTPPTGSEPVVAKKAGFASLFGAAKAASAKQDDQPWHQKGNKSAHEKKIGPAPSGTRRSMGKR
ncbi:hypothetical protein [Pseudomonas sp. XK-1]|jgi:hypothetical protein|uniref:hypothetical protein n=1 Tax=Pseudomonas sp. XK-1 TaxID=3136019 RepID=UPI002D75DABE|nr:hypothetical protein [Pseudomonas sp.]